MTSQQQLDFARADAGRSQNEKLRAHLEAHPCVWLAMVDLGHIIGAWAVHSRINDCRKKFGMHIERRVRLNTSTGQREASYFYDPALPSNFGCQKLNHRDTESAEKNNLPNEGIGAPGAQLQGRESRRGQPDLFPLCALRASVVKIP